MTEPEPAPDPTADPTGVRRREVLEAVGVTVAAGVVGFVGMTAYQPAEGAEGGYDDGGGDDGNGDDDGGADSGDRAQDDGEGDADDADEGGDGAEGTVVAQLADVPDGGGVVLADRRVVLVRDGDDVEAFTAVCTHQGCLVDEVADGEIRCPCHGSRFDARSGKVVRGPATQDLAEVDVEVRDGRVVLR